MPKLRSLHRRRAIVVTAVVVVVAGGSATALAMTSSGGASYRMVAAETASVRQTISATGTISPVHSAGEDFQVAGTVKKVKVTVGQHVTVGQILAWLDRSSLKAALRNAKSTLASDRTQLSDDETGQHSNTATSPASNGNSFLSSTPKVVTTPRPTGSPAAGGSGGGSGSGSGSSSKLAKDQQAVLADQKDTDAALAVASRALELVKSVCATTATSTQPGGATTTPAASPMPSPSPTSSSGATCEQATSALASDQTAVSVAQDALAKAEQKLNQDLGAALTATNNKSTGKSSTAKKPQSSTVPASTSSSVATAAELASDQAAIDQARATVATAKADLQQATLRSSIKGRITALGIKHGDSVSGSSSSTSLAIQIVGAGQDQVTISLSASEVRHVKIGMSAQVAPDGVDHHPTGTVASIDRAGSESASGSVSYPVTVTIPASNDLVSGAAANVTVIVATVDGVLTLPTSAIHHSGTATYVEVLKNGTPARHPITIAAVGAARTQVTSGLTAGQQVVLANYSQKVPSSSSTLTRNGGFGRNGFSGGGLTTVGGGGGFAPGSFSGGPPSFSKG